MKKNISGLIMSIEEGCAIVLTPKGEFVKTDVVSGQYFVGDEITFSVKGENQLWERLTATGLTVPKPALQLALSVCVVLAGGVGTWAYPVGHVYMDVNPSLGMSYNLYHRVISMESFNEDGVKVMGKVSYYGKTIDEGLENTLKAMDAEGYIKTEDQGVSGVLIGYTDPNLEKEFVKSIVETSDEIQKTLQVASVEVNSAAEQIAKEEKGQKDTISPIQATLAAQKLNRQNVENTKDKALKEQLKAEIKAEAKALKGKATLQLIEENQTTLKVVPNSKVEEIKKKNEAAKERIKEKKEREEKLKKERIKKESDHTDKEKAKEKKDKNKDEPKILVDRQLRLQKITNEIERLNVLMDQIQNGDGKENQKSAKIKKILRQIERLEAEAAKLQAN